jgi:hypothetical protein
MLAPVNFASMTAGSPEEPVYLYQVPADAITGVIMGARGNAALRTSVQELKRQDPRYSQLRLLEARVDERSSAIQLKEAE